MSNEKYKLLLMQQQQSSFPNIWRAIFGLLQLICCCSHQSLKLRLMGMMIALLILVQNSPCPIKLDMENFQQ